MDWIIYLAAFLFIILIIVFAVHIFGKSEGLPLDEMSGTEFEDYIADILYANGIEILEVTKASGDFGADIIAIYENERIAVQCKHYSKPVGVKAVQEAVSACSYYKCDRGAVIATQEFTRQAKELASESGVILWDRSAVLDFIANAEGFVKKRGLSGSVRVCRFSDGIASDEEMTLYSDGESYKISAGKATIIELPCGERKLILKHGRKKAVLRVYLTEKPITLVGGYTGKKLYLGEIETK